MNAKHEVKELRPKGFRLYNYIPVTSWERENFGEIEGRYSGIQYGLGDGFSPEVT